MEEIDTLDELYKIKQTMIYLSIPTNNVVFAGEIPEEINDRRKLFNKMKDSKYPVAYLGTRNCEPYKFKNPILMDNWLKLTIIDFENVYGIYKKIILCFNDNINKERFFYGTIFEAIEWILINKTYGCLTVVIEP
jgi:hypothetical protein